MVDQQYLIKNLLAGVAELGAANMLELLHPKMDLITQREAYKFFEEEIPGMERALPTVKHGLKRW